MVNLLLGGHLKYFIGVDDVINSFLKIPKLVIDISFRLLLILIVILRWTWLLLRRVGGSSIDISVVEFNSPSRHFEALLSKVLNPKFPLMLLLECECVHDS